MISLELEREIQKIAVEEYPLELCGFIVQDKFIKVNNTHESPKDYFRVSPEDWQKYSQVASSFIHSHPDWYPCPSESDMINQKSSAMPWGIIGTDGVNSTDIIFFGDQVPVPPLKNRFFCHGVTDCYSTIRDWYKIEKGIILKNMPRAWEWWEEEDKDLYRDNFESEGFEVISCPTIMKEGPRIGDVFLATIGPRVLKLNHGGVYVGNGLGLHHVTAIKPVDKTRLAKEEPIQRWLPRIGMWLRYKRFEEEQRDKC